MTSGSFNPRLLTLARESQGMSQTTLASLIGVTQSKIAKYESGLLAVSDRDLKSLASITEYPLAFFFEADPPRSSGSVCSHYRKRQSVPARRMRTIHARLDVLRFQVARLLRSVEIDRELQFPEMHSEAFDGGPAEIAMLLRSTWGIPRGPVSNLVSAIEEAGAIVIWCDFGTDRVDAISQRAPDLPPLFFVNDNKPGDRVRMTLAHEVGHAIMHACPDPDQESQADLFAAEFLMPADEILLDFRKPVTISQLVNLKAKWRVSIQALAVRAHRLELLTERQYRSMFTRISAQGWRKSEPIHVPREKASTLQELIVAHLHDCRLSVEELCELLRCNQRRFQEQFLPKRPIFRLTGRQ